MMISWFARGLLIAAGFVVSLFIASDSPQFGVMPDGSVASAFGVYRGSAGVLAYKLVHVARTPL
jgi:hypothetical protein